MKDDLIDERDFLHELATPLAIAFSLIELQLEDSQVPPTTQTIKVHKALVKLKTLLSERRQLLAKLDEKHSPPRTPT